MPYQNSFTTIKQKLFQENSSSALQQSINWIKFIKWDWQYYSRGGSNFQEKPHSRFTRSIWADWFSDKQETRRSKKTQFSGDKKKYSIKGKMDSLWKPRISHHLMDRAKKKSTHQFHKIFFHISKGLACNAEKRLQLKITKKVWI